ncbi:MAG TPA: alpha/beta hydrolase-fold protein [Gaiellaceae bacterium]
MRRTLAILALGLVAIGAWMLVYDRLRGYSSTRGTRVEHVTIHSRLLRRDLHEIVVTPAGAARGRLLLVFLHGRSSSPASNLHQQFFDTLKALGPRAPVVLLADGGDHSYWHDRRDGPWGSSLLREVIPDAVERSHTGQIAVGGISMGGFGALDVARLAPREFCAVGAHSAALWFSGGETPAGAFDDAADFGRHDVIRAARERRLYRVPVWIDVGRDDPFFRADLALAHALEAHGTNVSLHVHGGGHGGWSGRMAQYLRFYVGACA